MKTKWLLCVGRYKATVSLVDIEGMEWNNMRPCNVLGLILSSLYLLNSLSDELSPWHLLYVYQTEDYQYSKLHCLRHSQTHRVRCLLNCPIPERENLMGLESDILLGFDQCPL